MRNTLPSLEKSGEKANGAAKQKVKIRKSCRSDLPLLGKSRIIITCAKGITPHLKEEILALGFPILAEAVAGVETEGTMDDTLKLNLLIRTGHRVLYLLEEFHADHPDELYARASKIPWENYLYEDGYLCVTSSVDNPTIKDSRFASLRCKDAIVDRLRERCGRRPDSGPERTGAVIDLYWKGGVCRIYLDTSGEPLSRRGYRKIPLKAPMQETLAAAVIMATGWPHSGHFVNPMCGSGTLAIEAAWMGLARAPGLLRTNYGFMHLKGWNDPSWQDLLREAKGREKKSLDGRVIATDISAEAIRAARRNAAAAGVDHLIQFGVCDYAQTPIPSGDGIVMLNPEYGERLGKKEELGAVYKGIGDFFKNRCQGYRGYIFTGNPDLAKMVGLKAKRRIPFFNSNIECRLLEYDLYAGSRER